MKKLIRYISFIAFIVVVALLAWLMRPSQKQQSPAKTYQSYQTSERLILLPPNLNTLENTTEEYTEREIEEWAASRSDLAAQWNMVDTAFIGLCVGGLGLFFIAWTLIETRKASIIASGTLKFAQQSLNETKNSVRLDMQPYLACTKIEIIEIAKSTPPKIGVLKFDVQVTLRNMGKTPAYIETLENNSVASIDRDAGWESQKPTNRKLLRYNSAYPNNEVVINVCSVFKFEHGIKKISAETLYIRGEFTIWYHDSFTPTDKLRGVSFPFAWGRGSDEITRDNPMDLRLKDRELKL